MRRPLDADRIRRFMAALADLAEQDGRLYFTGGATAVLHGWRTSTIDVDIKLEPEADSVLRALPRLKEDLQMNVELAAPDQFIPPLPGWQDRSTFIAQHGRLTFFHYDFYSQALAKIQRGHAQDRVDVREMLDRGLVDRSQLRTFFEQIEPHLYRYPGIDAAGFQNALEEALKD